MDAGCCGQTSSGEWRDSLIDSTSAPAATKRPGRRLPGRVGAVPHVQRLLNVEGYPVLRIDADGVTVILDEVLLHEQFGIRI